MMLSRYSKHVNNRRYSYQERKDGEPARRAAAAAAFPCRVPVHVAQVVGAVAFGDVAAVLAPVRLHLCRAAAEVGVAELCGI